MTDNPNAATWLLADLDTGQVLAAKNAHGRQRPASTIKVLTALTALRELDPNSTIVGTQEDADQEGDSVGIQPGGRYTVRQVVTGMLMRSGNDASHALARELGGPAQMVRRMNETALSLGARDTRVATPSGLDGPGMSTSAYDMALIFRAATADPRFAAADRLPRMEFPGGPGQPPTQVVNQNQLLHSYPGAIGGKTGFTDDARHTYVGAAHRGDRRLVAVLMHGENEPVKLWKQGAELLDYGFALPRGAAVGQLVERQRPPTPARALPAPRHNPAEAGRDRNPATLFGTVGGPLSMLGVAAAVIAGLVVLRWRRIKITAAARRGNADQPSDRP